MGDNMLVVSELIEAAKSISNKIPFEGGVATYGNGSIYPANLTEVLLDDGTGIVTCIFSYDASKFLITTLIEQLETEQLYLGSAIKIKIIEESSESDFADLVEWNRDYSILAIL